MTVDDDGNVKAVGVGNATITVSYADDDKYNAAEDAVINVTVSKEGKLAYYTDPQIKAAIDDAKKQFGETGRIVVRPSGTEPLIRVMTEGEDRVLTESIAKNVSEIIKERLGGK